MPNAKRKPVMSDVSDAKKSPKAEHKLKVVKSKPKQQEEPMPEETKPEETTPAEEPKPLDPENDPRRFTRHTEY